MTKKIIILLLLIVTVAGLYGIYKPLPENISLEGKKYELPQSEVHFFADRTYINKNGNQKKDHEIFDEQLKMIKKANHFILVDMFLYNDLSGTVTDEYRPISKELTEALITKKEKNPEIKIYVTTDPINTGYGSLKDNSFKKLKEADISVTFTELASLRDSNPLYSAWWRSILRYIPPIGGNFLPNPFEKDGEGLTLSSYLSLLNFKANHRKIMVTDFERKDSIGMSTLVTSANPHDASSAHSNTAIRVDSSIWKDALKSEQAVLKMSEKELEKPKFKVKDLTAKKDKDTVFAQLLTEKKIKEKILRIINDLSKGDSLSIIMFYFSDRDIIKATKSAADRGVSVSILLDPNKDSFGREKNGVPNRQVAYELMKHSKGNLNIRWCLTHGEQCHGKMMIFEKENITALIQGSANMTRRNLNNLNLETDLLVIGHKETPAIKDAKKFFKDTWNNEPKGRLYSGKYELYENKELTKRILYRIGEFTGMSTY
ncbi:MAG: phospholipase D-like domain-containing protein [Patescibacteria group bacterium]